MKFWTLSFGFVAKTSSRGEKYRVYTFVFWGRIYMCRSTVASFIHVT
jgi:hypothetical protein